MIDMCPSKGCHFSLSRALLNICTVPLRRTPDAPHGKTRPRSTFLFLCPARLSCFACAFPTLLSRECLSPFSAAFSAELNRRWILSSHIGILTHAVAAEKLLLDNA